jgi:iron only hydrogenase large subunit-like protein
MLHYHTAPRVIRAAAFYEIASLGLAGRLPEAPEVVAELIGRHAGQVQERENLNLPALSRGLAWTVQGYEPDGSFTPETVSTVSVIPGACRGNEHETCACSEVCVVGAIQRDADGVATIDQERCVRCGRCIPACPVGAITDKAEIRQTITMIKDGNKPVYAILAPAFAGQFGAPPERVKGVLRAFGFSEVYEVALAADIMTLQEAEEFNERMQSEEPFMITSCCCPAFLRLVEKYRSRVGHLVSTSVSPMIALGRLLKAREPEARVVFIGPCIAKKSEAKRPELADAVEVVLTFEETLPMLKAAGLEPASRDDLVVPVEDASFGGRAYAYTGGVSGAIKKTINRLYPELEVRAVQGNGIGECNKLLKMAERGELEGNFMEGMACPGGCVGGPANLVKTDYGRETVRAFAEQSRSDDASSNPLARQFFEELAPRVKLTSAKKPKRVSA